MDSIGDLSKNDIQITVGYERGDDPGQPLPVDKKVPRKWYEGYKRAERVQENRLQQFQSHPEVKGIWIEPGPKGDNISEVKLISIRIVIIALLKQFLMK